MKKFLLFGAKLEGTRGGWLDYAFSFDTAEEAREHALNSVEYAWWHIVNTETGELFFSDEVDDEPKGYLNARTP